MTDHVAELRRLCRNLWRGQCCEERGIKPVCPFCRAADALDAAQQEIARLDGECNAAADMYAKLHREWEALTAERDAIKQEYQDRAAQWEQTLDGLVAERDALREAVMELIQRYTISGEASEGFERSIAAARALIGGEE